MEDARVARERRQARIRAGGADRLARITGSSGRSFMSERHAADGGLGNSLSDLPDQPPPATAPATQGQTGIANPDPSSLSDGNEGSRGMAPADVASDPLFQLLAQMQQSSGSSPTTSDHNSNSEGGPDLFSLLKQMNSGTGTPIARSPRAGGASSGAGAAAAYAQAQARASDVRARLALFTLIHVVAIAAVGLYVAWNPYSLVPVFLALETALATSRLFVDNGPVSPIITAMLPYLPEPVAARLAHVLKGIALLRGAYQDSCLVLFVFGLAQAIERTGANTHFARTAT